MSDSLPGNNNQLVLEWRGPWIVRSCLLTACEINTSYMILLTNTSKFSLIFLVKVNQNILFLVSSSIWWETRISNRQTQLVTLLVSYKTILSLCKEVASSALFHRG